MPSLKGCCEVTESRTARAERTLGFEVAAPTDERASAPQRLARPRPALTACARGSRPLGLSRRPRPRRRTHC